MPTDALMKAIHAHPFRPAGIKVSPDLWSELCKNGLIKYVRGYILGIADSGFDLPAIEDSIFVEIDLDLDEFEFRLPSESKR